MTDYLTQEGMDSLGSLKRTLEAQLAGDGAAQAGPLLPKATLEGMYSLAHAAFSVENYTEAEALFQGLVMLDAGNPRGWLGYGGASEAQSKWIQALEGYFGAAGLLPDDPVPPYKVGICFMALGEPDNARLAFEAAVGKRETVGGDPTRLPYVQRAESMIRLLDSGQGQA